MSDAGHSPDWAEEGLLDGLDADADREARLELLERMHAEGCSVDELRQAIDDDRLALLPVEKLLLRDRRYTMAETAELTGLSMDYLKADWRALGFSHADPDDRLAGDREVESLRAIKWMIDEGWSEAQLLELTRMVGDASSKLTDAILGVFSETLLKPGDSERDVGLRLTDIANALMPQLGDMLRGPMELHLADAVRREAVGSVERAQGFVPGGRPVAICFADMVGFTRLSEQVGITGVRDVTSGSSRSPRTLPSRLSGWSRRSATRRCSPARTRTRWSTPASRSSKRPHATMSFRRSERAPPPGRRCAARATGTASRSTWRRGSQQ